MTETEHIGNLIPDARNARKHNPRNIGMIADALQEVGPARSIVIDEDNNILAGNGTWEAAAQAGIERVQIIERDPGAITAVRVRGLSKRDKKRLAVYDNRTAELAEWEPAVLAEDKDILDGLFTTQELDDLLAGVGAEDGTDEQYSRKIEAPIYTPKGTKPSVSELYDDGKTGALLDAIDAADYLTDDERAFLTVAARRHTVLHYRKIADFYAHSDARVQRLMEDSALVIIDFKRAIELGFVKLAEQVAEQYGAEYGDA